MSGNTNYIAFCMDSLRWDVFQEAYIPHVRGFAEYTQVYSRAGCTIPSLFAYFMNLPWYESNDEKPLPQLGLWKWIPEELSKLGYFNALITQNPMLKRYADKFSPYFDVYNIFWKGLKFTADYIVDETIKMFESVKKPKFAFLLLTDTHQPYRYSSIVTDEIRNKPNRPIEDQVRALERTDVEFGRLVKALQGTNTDILVFSDHGDLSKREEGSGHGAHVFHRKLFEIPLGRKTI